MYVPRSNSKITVNNAMSLIVAALTHVEKFPGSTIGVRFGRFAFYPSLVQPETDNDVNVRYHRLCSAHSRRKLPPFQCLQSCFIHRLGHATNESDVSDGAVRQDGHGDCCVTCESVLAS